MRCDMRFLLILLSSLALSLQAAVADMKKGADAGTNLLEQTSQAFTQIAKKAMPCTVFIKAQVQTAAPQYSPDPFQDDFFRRFFGQNPFQNQQPQQQQAAGSGFIIRQDGYIVTNFHVVKDATQISVMLNDGREYPAVIKGTDPRTDLAVLKIDEKNLPFLEFGDSDDLQVGEWVVAIGNPFGLEGTLTVGVVSAKGRQDLGIASYEDFIQTDAAINPGNSGGPLLNLQNQVIGVNTAIVGNTGGYMGIGFAIPSRMVQNVIEQILDGGTVKRAYLGIVLQPVDKELADALSLDKQDGILVSEVVKDSPAQQAGVLQGDIILSYNDKPVKNVAKFRNEVALMTPGSTIKLRVLRNQKQMDISVTLGSQNENEVITGEVLSKIGLELENLTPELSARLGYTSDTEGVVISKIKPGSPAAMAGLRAGFLITGVAINGTNQKRVKNLAEFDNAMKDLGDKKHIILIVRHQNFQRYYTIKIN
ncbi:MAG: Do family serine endopeptidase [Verrucomicrobiota bacterium]|nr:Do family serine endopeptidase [Verrucomicrobiota bacterium]